MQNVITYLGNTTHISTDTDMFHLQILRDPADIEAVYRLVHDAYVWRGYAAKREDGLLRHHEEFDRLAETTTIAAIRGGSIIGAVSNTRDSVRGLPLDCDFADPLNSLRAQGKQLMCGWRLAVHPSYHQVSRSVSIELLKACVTHFMQSSADTYVAEFNPRHAFFYRKFVGAVELARRNENSFGLKHAPGVLMMTDKSRVSGMCSQPRHIQPSIRPGHCRT